MGACVSLPVPTHFSLSLAPSVVTENTPERICTTCSQAIEKNTLHLSHTPPPSLLCVVLGPHIERHYHFDHGMHVAAMKPCGRNTLPPTFSCPKILSVTQKRRVQVASRHAVGLWQARKDMKAQKDPHM